MKIIKIIENNQMSRSSFTTLVIGIEYPEAKAFSSFAGLYFPCNFRLLFTYRTPKILATATTTINTEKLFL